MNKKLYWLSSFTWGLLETIIGFIVWIFFKCLRKKSTVYKGSIRTEVGNMTKGGCFSLGIFTFVNYGSKDISDHEFGHCIQNAMYGIFKPFIVSIPSVIDYWIRRLSKNPDWSKHDNLWFEKQATELGSKEW